MSEEVKKEVPFEEVLRKAIHDVDVYRDPDLTEFRRRWNEIAAALGESPLGQDCIECIKEYTTCVEVSYSWSSRGCYQTGTSRIPKRIITSEDPIRTAVKQRVDMGIAALGSKLNVCLNDAAAACDSYLRNLVHHRNALQQNGIDEDLSKPWSDAVDTKGTLDLQRSMLVKLSVKRSQGRGGWDDPLQCTNERLAELLVDHVRKGDPVDIANFCMMLHARKAPISVIQEAFKAAMEDRKICDLSGGFDCTNHNPCEICHRYDNDTNPG